MIPRPTRFFERGEESTFFLTSCEQQILTPFGMTTDLGFSAACRTAPKDTHLGAPPAPPCLAFCSLIADILTRHAISGAAYFSAAGKYAVNIVPEVSDLVNSRRP